MLVHGQRLDLVRIPTAIALTLACLVAHNIPVTIETVHITVVLCVILLNSNVLQIVRLLYSLCLYVKIYLLQKPTIAQTMM